MKIGELASATATNVETVRYYEKIGLLPAPARTNGNYRSYGVAHLQRLSFIRRARDLLALTDDREKPCQAVDEIASRHLSEVERKISDLAAMRDELRVVIGNCRHGTIGDCKIIETLGPRVRPDPK